MRWGGGRRPGSSSREIHEEPRTERKEISTKGSGASKIARQVIKTRAEPTVEPEGGASPRLVIYGIINIDAQDIQDLVSGVWCPVVPGIRKPAPDHRPSRLLVQQPPVLIILSILSIDVKNGKNIDSRRRARFHPPTASAFAWRLPLKGGVIIGYKMGISLTDQAVGVLEISPNPNSRIAISRILNF